ncbi:MAG: transketolase [Deltaproteobacteria bacterium]|nr:transketolase [Deltaproteobacteria bacterium]
MDVSKEDDLDQLCINTIRMLAVDAVEKARSGHPGMPMEAADIGYILWTRFLKHNPGNPDWPNRDRFVLSAGHGSMLLYALLHLTGYEVSLDDIRQFRQWKSKTPGHPEYGQTPGVETTTGPLGQGFSNAVGMAIANEYLAEYFNRPDYSIVDYFIYGLAGDGDMMEGITSEAASLAGHLGLGRLIFIYLDNRITIEGNTELTFTEDVAKRFSAYGWHVEKVDGYDLSEIVSALDKGKEEAKRPSLIIARTHIGFGSPNKQDTASAHGEPLGAEEVRLLRERLAWPETLFHVPDKALTHFRDALVRGRESEADWLNVFQAYAKEYPDLAAEWKDFHNGKLPTGWQDTLPAFKPNEGPIATRSASGKVLEAVAPKMPALLGGSADLAPSTKTFVKGLGVIKQDPCGRNIHFGIREHAMGGVLNGMALSQALVPYGATFLVFSDYMRPAIRLAALMHLQVIYVFTHDSVAVGEDGPTHQPVEHVAALRIIPGLVVLRPADANETAYAWKLALDRKEGPTALVLTRQKLPVIDRTRFASPDGLLRGAYVLADPPEGEPEILLLASGSEVPVALGAYEKLSQEGIAVRVVSMPSWEVFEAQDETYRNEVLPTSIRARVAIEAGTPLGWERYVGSRGKVIGIDHFGASAPGGLLLEKFGFTTDNVIGIAKEVLGLVKNLQTDDTAKSPKCKARES